MRSATVKRHTACSKGSLRIILRQFNGHGRRALAKQRVTASQLAHFQSRPKAKDIVPATDLFDPAHPLFDKTCVLTGELLKLSDREAMQRIADCGGKNADNVTKKTDFLIVGGGSPSEKKSGKVRKAEEYIEKGIPIRIISEEEFLQM